ncbi:hypothetical protein M758_1G270000 [Ceratodon purpureus]|nr:hypothetical protein M758_1G270000 [Ceratodon purpureus]
MQRKAHETLMSVVHQHQIVVIASQKYTTVQKKIKNHSPLKDNHIEQVMKQTLLETSIKTGTMRTNIGWLSAIREHSFVSRYQVTKNTKERGPEGLRRQNTLRSCSYMKNQ